MGDIDSLPLTHGKNKSNGKKTSIVTTCKCNVATSPKRGPSRPLNFFGYLTSRTMDRLADALSPGAYNHTFVVSK